MTNEHHLMINQHEGRKAKAVQWAAKALSCCIKDLRKNTAA